MILKDRVALVTGRWLGHRPRRRGDDGARGCACGDRRPGCRRRSRCCGRRSAAEGYRAEAHAVDVTDDDALSGLVSDVLGRLGRVDILHNHAGAQVAGDLEGSIRPASTCRGTLNVRSHFMAARLVVPTMRSAGKGVILNTSSSSGVLYDREMIAYTTTKHAVIAMTRQMAGDYARYGIRVNALCPGWVDTPFNAPFIAQMGGRDAHRGLYAREGAARPMGHR